MKTDLRAFALLAQPALPIMLTDLGTTTLLAAAPLPLMPADVGATTWLALTPLSSMEAETLAAALPAQCSLPPVLTPSVPAICARHSLSAVLAGQGTRLT